MISLVVGTVLIYGSLMPLIAHCLLGQREEVHIGLLKPSMKKFDSPLKETKSSERGIEVKNLDADIESEEEKENDLRTKEKTERDA